MFGEAPDGFTVYRLEFEDGSAYVGRTRRSVVRRLSEHLLDGGPVQERIAAGLAMRVAILGTGLEDALAASVEHEAIGNLDKAINRQGARTGATAVNLPHVEHAAAMAARVVHVPFADGR